MASLMSKQLIGKQIDGIWHTGIVIHNKEYYFGMGIGCEPPGGTHFGKSFIMLFFSNE